MFILASFNVLGLGPHSTSAGYWQQYFEKIV
jgi:hypothetical protein